MKRRSPISNDDAYLDQATANDAWTGYKRSFDLVLLGAAHLFLLPLWLILWIVIPTLIWTSDRGPVFYRQERMGKDGKIFTVLKFRTMVKDADRLGPAWTSAGDHRITKVGKFLRRSALDELPELISVLWGDMSLVGPRPLDVSEHRRFEKQVPGFSERLRVVPGLTGLAQVYDRSDDASDKFRYDIEYIQRMSPWLDLKLILISAWNTATARWDGRSGKAASSGEVTLKGHREEINELGGPDKDHVNRS